MQACSQISKVSLKAGQLNWERSKALTTRCYCSAAAVPKGLSSARCNYANAHGPFVVDISFLMLQTCSELCIIDELARTAAVLRAALSALNGTNCPASAGVCTLVIDNTI